MNNFSQKAKSVTMNSDLMRQSLWRTKWLPTLLCWLIAAPVALVGLLRGLLQLLVMGGLKYDCWEHFAIFFVGWLFALACLISAYILTNRSSYHRLWVLIPCILLFTLDRWLGSLPAAENLIH
ncbi:MAG: hypothetical protein V4819_24845 [Verrucomicrobiota bacterium]